MFRYRPHLEHGSDAGEATYAQMIKPGEEIIAGKNQHFRVVAVVPFEEEDESPSVGLLGGDLLATAPLSSHQEQRWVTAPSF